MKNGQAKNKTIIEEKERKKKEKEREKRGVFINHSFG